MAERGAAEPTEEPTARRLADARRRGDVARSRDLSGAAVLAAAFGALAAIGGGWLVGLTAYFGQALGGATRGMPLHAAGELGLLALVRAFALPLGAAVVAALGIGLLQTRGLLSFEPLRPDLARLSPAGSLARLFGPAAAGEMAKGIVQVAVVGVVAWVTIRPHLRAVAALAGASPQRAATAFGVLAESLGFRIMLASLLMGCTDYLWRRARHRRTLRMTPDEVKREHRETEGDPRHRAERQRLHRQLLEQRMVDDVRRADFVVVNPDHIAVALRYERDGGGAPVVVAKGERLVAERIKEAAREAGVPIFREVTLARSLRELEQGDEIPEPLYQAVAEILRIIYGMPPAAPGPIGAEQSAAAPPLRPSSGWKRV